MACDGSGYVICDHCPPDDSGMVCGHCGGEGELQCPGCDACVESGIAELEDDPLLDELQELVDGDDEDDDEDDEDGCADLHRAAAAVRHSGSAEGYVFGEDELDDSEFDELGDDELRDLGLDEFADIFGGRV
jgi:hypothetical protein